MSKDQRPPIPRQCDLHWDRMCTCAMHCASSEHHERACCDQVYCLCWCHAEEYAPVDRQPGQRLGEVTTC